MRAFKSGCSPHSWLDPRHSALIMPSLLSIIDLLVLLSSLFALWAIRDYRRRGTLPYPPGPRPLPLIGNLFHIPKKFSWLAYTHFSKEYGMNRFIYPYFSQ